MRGLVLGGLLILAGCGGGSTTGTNYSDPPPMAEIVATPSPRASEAPEPEAEATAPEAANTPAADNTSGDVVTNIE